MIARFAIDATGTQPRIKKDAAPHFKSIARKQNAAAISRNQRVADTTAFATENILGLGFPLETGHQTGQGLSKCLPTRMHNEYACGETKDTCSSAGRPRYGSLILLYNVKLVFLYDFTTRENQLHREEYPRALHVRTSPQAASLGETSLRSGPPYPGYYPNSESPRETAR
jgi:hypothetical protein